MVETLLQCKPIIPKPLSGEYREEFLTFLLFRYLKNAVLLSKPNFFLMPFLTQCLDVCLYLLPGLLWILFNLPGSKTIVSELQPKLCKYGVQWEDCVVCLPSSRHHVLADPIFQSIALVLYGGVNHLMFFKLWIPFHRSAVQSVVPFRKPMLFIVPISMCGNY